MRQPCWSYAINVNRYITFSKNFQSFYSINLCQHFCPWWVGKIKDNCGQNGGSMFRIDPGTTVSSRMINNDSYQRFHTHSILTTFKNTFKSRVAGFIVEIDFMVTRFSIFNLFGPTYNKEWSCNNFWNIWKTNFFLCWLQVLRAVAVQYFLGSSSVKWLLLAPKEWSVGKEFILINVWNFQIDKMYCNLTSLTNLVFWSICSLLNRNQSSFDWSI